MMIVFWSKLAVITCWTPRQREINAECVVEMTLHARPWQASSTVHITVSWVCLPPVSPLIWASALVCNRGVSVMLCYSPCPLWPQSRMTVNEKCPDVKNKPWARYAVWINEFTCLKQTWVYVLLSVFLKWGPMYPRLAWHFGSPNLDCSSVEMIGTYHAQLMLCWGQAQGFLIIWQGLYHLRPSSTLNLIFNEKDWKH